MQDRLEREIQVVTETAPQRRLDVDCGVPVPDGSRIIEPLGGGAMPVFTHVVPLAVAAWQVVLEEDEVAVLEPFQPLEVAADLRKGADVLVAHDERRAAKRQLVLADVGAADTGNFYLEEGGVRGDVGEVDFAQLGRRWTALEGSQRFSPRDAAG